MDIDDQVWGKLQALAEPLVDTPNSVLRRVLGLDLVPERPRSSGTPERSSRAPVGSLLPEAEYELPILKALADAGGRAPTRDVIHAVGQMVADRLTSRDRDSLPNGAEHWHSRVQFSRLRLKERGLIKSGSPRGIWELSDAGAAFLEDGRTQ